MTGVASPSPAPAAGQEPVALRDGALVVRCLTVADADTVSAARAARAAGHELDGWARACLRAGAIASTAAGTGLDLATVERSLHDLAAQTGRRVDAHLGELAAVIQQATGPDGPMARTAVEQVTRLATGVGALLTGPDATVPARLAAAVTAAAEQALADLRRDLAAQAGTLSATVGQDRATLHQAITAQAREGQAQVSEQLAELRAVLAVIATRQAEHDAAAHAAAAATAAAPTASSGPGRAYEALAAAAIARAAAAAGLGGATHLGDQAGFSGTRTGDVVVDLAGDHPVPVRVVFEAKARAKYSAESARSELGRARTNRQAAYGCLLTPASRSLVDGTPLFWLTGTDLAITWDPDDAVSDAVLSAALQLLAGLAQRSTRVTAGGLDITQLQRAADDMQAALGPFADITRAIGSAEAALGRARAAATALQHDLTDRIAALRDTVK